MFLAWWNKAEIPTGWLLCDGDNGTPDLREKFVRCAYSDITRPPGGTGGGEKHAHSIEDAGHSHSTLSRSHSHASTSGSHWKSGSTHGPNTHSHDHGSSSTEDHGHGISEEETLPRYTELVIIATTDEAEREEFPVGIIAMWAGSVDSIPSGWAFCDGGGDRPDLRDKFLKGADEAGATGGGSLEHSHGLSDSSAHSHSSAQAEMTHAHGRTGYPTTGFAYNPPSTQVQEQDMNAIHSHILASSGIHDHNGLEEASGDLPAFYALAFIRREA